MVDDLNYCLIFFEFGKVRTGFTSDVPVERGGRGMYVNLDAYLGLICPWRPDQPSFTSALAVSRSKVNLRAISTIRTKACRLQIQVSNPYRRCLPYMGFYTSGGGSGEMSTVD